MFPLSQLLALPSVLMRHRLASAALWFTRGQRMPPQHSPSATQDLHGSLAVAPQGPPLLLGLVVGGGTLSPKAEVTGKEFFSVCGV